MKFLTALAPRDAVLDGTADFVVNLADLAERTEAEAREFLDANVLTSGMELPLSQAFARLAGTGGGSSGRPGPIDHRGGTLSGLRRRVK